MFRIESKYKLLIGIFFVFGIIVINVINGRTKEKTLDKKIVMDKKRI